jgi:hypothetical protein
LETEEINDLVTESVSKEVRSWVLIFFDRGRSSPKPDAIEKYNHNLATVPGLEYYYPSRVVTDKVTRMNNYLSNRIKYY